MNIKTEDDITPQAMLKLRLSMGLSQAKFWKPVCVSAARGSRYETLVNPIPAEIKRLLFLFYGLELPIDSPEIADLTKRVKINKMQRTLSEGIDSLKQQLAGG